MHRSLGFIKQRFRKPWLAAVSLLTRKDRFTTPNQIKIQLML